jgi:hypothetical protein
MTDQLCYGCKRLKPVAYVQPGTEQPFCDRCEQAQPLTVEDWAVFALASPTSPIGPRFAPGDVVEARTAALIYDGVGVIEEMSMDLKNGGTPIYPTFLVRLTEKAHDLAPDADWYTEVCLTKTEQKQEAHSD